MHIQSLVGGSKFGAVVTGLCVQQVCHDGSVRENLRELFVERGGLLVVRGMTDMSAVDMVDACSAFGEVDRELDSTQKDFCVDGEPGVLRIGNVRDVSGKPISANAVSAPLHGSPQYDIETQSPVWHTDGVYREKPPVGSALLCVRAPPSGGATCFADATKAYEDLEPQMKDHFESLEALASLTHHDTKVHKRGSPDYPLPTAADRIKNPVRRVPLVLTHPLSKKKALYGLNSGTFAVLPKGTPMSEEDLDRFELTGEEHPSVFENLKKYLPTFTDPQKYSLAHQWQPGDLLIWDNRCTIHAATGFDANNYTREMWRVTINNDHHDSHSSSEIEISSEDEE